MKKIFAFGKEYYLLSAVIVSVLIGAGLFIAGHSTATQVLLSGVALLIALRLSVDMVGTLKEGKYGIDILAITAIISTIAVGEYWASIVIVLMLTGGEALEDYAAKRAKRELSALLERAPQTAHKVVGNDTKTIRLSQVKIGDILLVKPGEVVPVDAVLQDASAVFDESSLTGESLPVEHKKGEQLLSGSVNGSDAITIKTLRTAKDSQYQQIIELVKAASSTETPFIRLADRYAVPFTIVAYIIAISAWIVSGDPVRLAEVLVVATPCPLLLAAPIAIISGMSRAAKNGIIIKGGGILEKLATIKTVAFDKTGTLTKGTPEIAAVKPHGSFTEKQLLHYATSAEQQSAHILAHALVSASKAKKVTLAKPTQVKEVTAQGMSAVVDKKKVLVGKQSFLQKAGVKTPEGSLRSGETAVYVAIDGTYAGYISFSDTVRPESKKVIADLGTMGIHETYMLTGDSAGTAKRIAAAVGVTNIHSELLPVDKVNVVRDIEHRPVLMVGDGVNDAPVLAVADVGMAMGARGSTAASESADVVVLVDDISKSAQAIHIAKHTMSIALQSIWVGIAISVMLMLVASTGKIPAVVGAGLQEVVDVIVIFNALRAHGPFGKAAR